MLRMEMITKETVNEALTVFHKIFSWIPMDCDPYTDVVNGAMPEMKARYYMVYDDETLVGITGFYIVPEDPESAFLGWFGVLPEMRRFHYGSKILKLHEDELKKLGYKYSRLYTETNNNDATRAFYERNGYVGEAYDCPEESPIMKNMITVYSKSLGDYELLPWDNRNMNLTEEGKMIYSKENLENIEEVLEKSAKAVHA